MAVRRVFEAALAARKGVDMVLPAVYCFHMQYSHSTACNPALRNWLVVFSHATTVSEMLLACQTFGDVINIERTDTFHIDVARANVCLEHATKAGTSQLER